MSRIGKQPVVVPDKVTIELNDKSKNITVKGPKGETSMVYHQDIVVSLDDGKIVIARGSNDRKQRSLHGLVRALIANQIKGVTEGFSKGLEIHGTGYSAKMQGKTLVLQIGFCHPVEIPVPEGLVIEVKTGKPIEILISGVDKQRVGQLAAQVRAIRPPDPYKQKGIRYKGEHIIKKEGKAFGKK